MLSKLTTSLQWQYEFILIRIYITYIIFIVLNLKSEAISQFVTFLEEEQEE